MTPTERLLELLKIQTVYKEVPRTTERVYRITLPDDAFEDFVELYVAGTITVGNREIEIRNLTSDDTAEAIVVVRDTPQKRNRKSKVVL